MSARRRAVQVELGADQVTLLRLLVRDLTELLGDGRQPGAEDDAMPADPLAELLDIPAEAPRPADPAVLRLLPDAYADDAASASDFRRFTEGSLRERKLHDATVLLATLDRAEGGAVRLDRDELRSWVGCLNDLRLVLGARIGVTEEWRPEPEDPAFPLALAYDFLTAVQAYLVDRLA